MIEAVLLVGVLFVVVSYPLVWAIKGLTYIINAWKEAL